MKALEHFIASIILASRWILVVFYLGLTLAFALYAVSFSGRIYESVLKFVVQEETDGILDMLSLIEAALVASLVILIIIVGYENFVNRSGKGEIDTGSVKIKVASTIVVISSIHLLQVFLNSSQYTDTRIMWLTIMHMAFVFSTFLVVYIDKVIPQTEKGKGAEH